MGNASFFQEQLKACELFQELSDHELAQLYSHMQTIHLKAGDVLVRQGKPSRSMHVNTSKKPLHSVKDLRRHGARVLRTKHRFDVFVRTIGLVRARVMIGLVNLAYHMKRLVFLEEKVLSTG